MDDITQASCECILNSFGPLPTLSGDSRPLDKHTTYKLPKKYRRRMRREARELCAGIMGVLLHVCGYQDRRVIMPVTKIAEILEIPVNRVSRGLKHLRIGGILTTVRKAIYNGNRAGEPSFVTVREIHSSFFEKIGVAQTWEKLKEWKKRYKKKLKKRKALQREKENAVDIALAMAAGRERAKIDLNCDKRKCHPPPPATRIPPLSPQELAEYEELKKEMIRAGTPPNWKFPHERESA